MKRSILIALLACLTTATLHAQTTVTVWLSSQQNGGGDSLPVIQPDATIDFANGSGYGISASRMFGARLSGELSLFRTSSDGAVRANVSSLANGIQLASLGEVRLTPITAMVRYHFRPGAPLDVYVGAGGAHVMTRDLDSSDLRDAGLAPLKLDDETTFVAGAGVTWSFSDRWGASLDARYLPLTLHASAVGTTADAGIDPLIVSAGLRIRF